MDIPPEPAAHVAATAAAVGLSAAAVAAAGGHHLLHCLEDGGVRLQQVPTHVESQARLLLLPSFAIATGSSGLRIRLLLRQPLRLLRC